MPAISSKVQDSVHRNTRVNGNDDDDEREEVDQSTQPQSGHTTIGGKQQRQYSTSSCGPCTPTGAVASSAGTRTRIAEQGWVAHSLGHHASVGTPGTPRAR